MRMRKTPFREIGGRDMVTIPLFVSIVVRRDAIDRAGRTTSRAVIDARKKWHDDDDWYDDDLIVFRGGMGGAMKLQ